MLEELIKLLTDTAGYLRDTRNHAWPYVESGQQYQDMLNIAARIDSTLAALAAQQQEPVARVKRNTGCSGREFIGESLDFIDFPIGAKLYTAPQSGVREGMLRAAEICKGILVECIKNQKERGDHAVIAMCREAITRAADQVNAEDKS